ncbi:YciI family protein [Clostridium sp. HV4-5-A1G]|uniref:YciI family protein n=1 Tax=Clostridium sp. HV4-5-A1G TaxID=2004595 RepID=UPI001239F7AA|nr:YciI family protein [Clostridium sp. HV4-5-A1G]KAA8669678.1 hypothetical protein F3O63_13120 [Clostridium sp. HV4-5-A1G]
MQYIVIAYDGTGEKVTKRRLAVREQHLKIVEENFKAGRQIYGGAILDDNKKMIGSMMVMNYENREALNKWMETEPYISEKVWDKIEIQSFSTASIFMDK